jgi:hypothetical protein
MPIFTSKITQDGLLSRLSRRLAKPQATPSFERISGAQIPRQLPQHRSHGSVISGVELNRLQEHSIKMKSRVAQLAEANIIPGTNDIQKSESLNMRGERRGGGLRVVNLTENDLQSPCDSDETRTSQQNTASQNGEGLDDSELINKMATLFQEIEATEGKKRKEILDGHVDKILSAIDHDTKPVLRDVGAERKTNIVIFQMPEAAFSAEVGYARVGFREKCRAKWTRWFGSHEKGDEVELS